MPEPTLDPHTDQLLDERVRTARTELQRTIGDVPPPALRSTQNHNEQRRMLIAAAAIAAVLAAGSLAFLATGQESSVSTTDTPSSLPDEQPPTATDETTTSTTTSSTTTAPPPETTTSTTTAPPAEEPAPPPPAQQQPPEDPAVHLVGKTFAGTTVTESGQPRPLVEGTEITVTFEHNQHIGEDVVRWYAGCNAAGESVVISADRLDVGNGGGMTAVGCDQDGYDQDEWLAGFFHADPYWMLDGGTLTLTVGDTVITLGESRSR